LRLTPEALAALLDLVAAGSLTAASAREALAECAATGRAPEAIVRERGLEAVTDRGELEAIVARVLAAHPEPRAKLRAGDAKLLNFFVGQVMRETRGKGNPALVREILAREVERS
jgi:aspartyl-tRNA(Asn)/glutamyl-tRNA(Gln) amidotransferase subunit B